MTYHHYISLNMSYRSPHYSNNNFNLHQYFRYKKTSKYITMCYNFFYNENLFWYL